MAYVNYRKIYIDNFGPIPIDEEGKTFEIHHKDGNRSNNEPNNLIALSIHDHFDIHRLQGDVGACLAIARRSKFTIEQISQISSEAQRKNVENGTHTFAQPGFQRDLQQRILKEGRHISQRDPEQHKKNGLKGGLKGKARIEKEGWTDEQIAKRVATRKAKGSFKNNMKAANTPEAIAKRVATRKANRLANANVVSCSHVSDSQKS